MRYLIVFFLLIFTCCLYAKEQSCDEQCLHCINTKHCTPKDIQKCRCRCQKEQKVAVCDDIKAQCVTACASYCEPVAVNNFVCCTNCSMKHTSCTAAANTSDCTT